VRFVSSELRRASKFKLGCRPNILIQRHSTVLARKQCERFRFIPIISSRALEYFCFVLTESQIWTRNNSLAISNATTTRSGPVADASTCRARRCAALKYVMLARCVCSRLARTHPSGVASASAAKRAGHAAAYCRMIRVFALSFGALALAFGALVNYFIKSMTASAETHFKCVSALAATALLPRSRK
jgi:hypothetical protein